MEHVFAYQPGSDRFEVRLEHGFTALARLLEEELGAVHVLAQLQQQLATPAGEIDCGQWRVQWQQGEVQLRHHSLFSEEQTLEPELDYGDSDLCCECGLTDLQQLLDAWQQFMHQQSA